MVETTVEQKVNKYLLKGEKRNESWQLSTRRFVNHEGSLRRIKYCEGETSIFEDEQHKDSKVKYIWFELGSLLVPGINKTLNKYIQAHPDFNKKFYLHDEQRDAKNELEMMLEEDGLREMLRSLSQEEMEAVATVIFGLNVVERWSPEKIQLECIHQLKRNPKRLKEVINDPGTQLIYLVAAAIRLNIIKIPSTKLSVQWAESGAEIIPVPRGINPLTEMSQFLRTTDGLVTLQEIGDRVNKKKGIKVEPKKSTRAKTKK